MNLVDMKRTPEEQQADSMPHAYKESPYPYGLRIYLDDDTLDKLGVEDLPDLNAEFTITAKVKVSARNESSDPGDPDGDNDNKSMELQITALALGLEESDSKKASKLYPENK